MPSSARGRRDELGGRALPDARFARCRPSNGAADDVLAVGAGADDAQPVQRAEQRVAQQDMLQSSAQLGGFEQRPARAR